MGEEWLGEVAKKIELQLLFFFSGKYLYLNAGKETRACGRSLWKRKRLKFLYWRKKERLGESETKKGNPSSHLKMIRKSFLFFDNEKQKCGKREGIWRNQMMLEGGLNWRQKSSLSITLLPKQSRKKLSLRIGLFRISEKPLEKIRGKMIEFLSALKRWGRRKRKKKFDQTRKWNPYLKPHQVPGTRNLWPMEFKVC